MRASLIHDRDHLFVYGSLLRRLGHPMARLLQRRARYVGTGSIAGRLYDLGPYPAAVTEAVAERGGASDAAARRRVKGEVYVLPRPADALLAALDRYEGCAGGMSETSAFVRRRVKVRLAGGSCLSAWAYLFAGDVSAARAVAGGDYAAFRARTRPRRR